MCTLGRVGREEGGRRKGIGREEEGIREDVLVFVALFNVVLCDE